MTMSRGREQKPPPPVIWAVVLTLVNAVGGVVFSIAWPDLDERGTVVTVSSVLGALMVALALWLWTGSRWGAIGTLGLNAFNVLLAIPAFFQDDGSLIVGGVPSMLLSALAIVFLLRPAAREFWGRRAA